jgi:hypothetical protein
VATKFSFSLGSQYWETEATNESEFVDSRECGWQAHYRKPNKKKLYPEDTVFCLRYSAEGKRRWETLDVVNLNAALAARATRETTVSMRKLSACSRARTKISPVKK